MFDIVLSKPPVLNIPEFWIVQDSEYVSGSDGAKVLDLPGFWICLCFWICQGYTGFKICLNTSWICLIMFGYVHSRITGLHKKGEGISLTPHYHFHPLQTLRHYPGDYCRELTSAHRQQLDSNGEPFASEDKSLTTKLHAIICVNMPKPWILIYPSSYPIFVKLLTFSRSAPSFMKSLLIMC